MLSKKIIVALLALGIKSTKLVENPSEKVGSRLSQISIATQVQ